MSHPPGCLTFHLIPHTHWDREWYLTRAAFQARLIPVLDDVLEQLEADPGARFLLDGQTVLLEDYLAVHPENEARLAAQVQRGALEIGPWYVLSDLLIPSAASLRRNLAEGAHDAARFGRRLDVLYSPDAFGHPSELPALAAEFGIRRAVVRRGLGRPQGVDRDLYRWKSQSGQSMLVHHLPAGGYDTAIGLVNAGKKLPARWASIRRELVGRARGTQIAVFLGADHHAMPREAGALREQLRRLEPNHDVRMSSLTEYFDAVEAGAPDAPVITGELRQIQGHAWVLQDVHSTRSAMKRRHARAELALSRIAEPLAGLATEQGGVDRSGLLRLAWRTLLQCQFHDTLAGTTSDLVQREQEVRLDTVEALAKAIATSSLHEVTGHDPDRARGTAAESRLILWNPSARARSGIMISELTCFRRDIVVGPLPTEAPRVGAGVQPFSLRSADGEELAVQMLALRRDHERIDAMRRYPDQDEVDRVWVAFRAPEVSASGRSSLALARAGRPPLGEGLEAGAGVLSNRFVRVTVSVTGALTLEGRRSGERYEGLCQLEDEPDRGDLYTFSGVPGQGVRRGQGLSQRILAAGPLVGGIETRWSIQPAGPGRYPIRQVISLHADSPLVRIRLDVMKMGKDHRLRAWFPVGAGSDALAGSAFGVERRPVVDASHDEVALERAARTAPAHRFVAAGAGTRGLAVFAPGCFEYEWTAERQLAVTLFRSTGELARDGLPERPGMAAWSERTPLAQELGQDTIELGVAPAESDAAREPQQLVAHWEDAFLPVQTVFLRSCD